MVDDKAVDVIKADIFVDAENMHTLTKVQLLTEREKLCKLLHIIDYNLDKHSSKSLAIKFITKVIGGVLTSEIEST